MGLTLSSKSLDLYEGRIKIVKFDVNRLDELELILGKFLDELGPGDELFANVKNGSLVVRILNRTSDD